MNILIIYWPTFGFYSVTERERNELREFDKYLISSLFCQNSKTGGCSAEKRYAVTGYDFNNQLSSFLFIK